MIPANLTGNVGGSFDLGTYVSDNPASYAASGLPPRLYLNSGTGKIFGVPTSAGTYVAVLSATNVLGSDQVAITFAIAATGAAPAFSGDTAAVSGTVGGSFDQSFHASSSAVNYTLSGLPPGLSYSFSPGSSGSIQGTPTATGVYPVTIMASNAAGTASEYTGNDYDEFYLFDDGLPPDASTYAAGGLPPGLSLDRNTGEITGTPIASGNSRSRFRLPSAQAPARSSSPLPSPPLPQARCPSRRLRFAERRPRWVSSGCR